MRRFNYYWYIYYYYDAFIINASFDELLLQEFHSKFILVFKKIVFNSISAGSRIQPMID
jgi:hypothetical protein